MAHYRPPEETAYIRWQVISVSVRLFLEQGYSRTTIKDISAAAGISAGTIMKVMKSKEDILAQVIEKLAEFQWNTVRKLVDEGETPLAALGFELTAMAVMCEESEVARDLYISAYTSDKSLEIIRKNDMARAREVFGQFCPGWTEDHFAEAETLVSGIEYTTLRVTPSSPPLETRIAGAMDTIFRLYHVPEEQRQRKIRKALDMDYRQFARKVLSDFKDYAEQSTRRERDRAALRREERRTRRETPS